MRLRSKFSILIVTLIIIVIGATAFLAVNQARQQLLVGITNNSRSFAELTAEQVVTAAETYLPQQSFVIFNPIITDLLNQNDAIANIQIYRYDGELIYDRLSERNQQYTGEPRQAAEAQLPQIQSQYPSITMASGQNYFWQADDLNRFLNREGQLAATQPELSQAMADSVYVPVDNTHAVRYEISYQALTEQLRNTTYIVSLLAAFAVVLSLMIGLGFTGVLTKNLQKLTAIVGKIATGDLKQRAQIDSKDEVGSLAKAVNQMTADLEKSMAARIFQEKTQKELELAAKIQLDLLPEALPDTDKIDFHADLQSADEISGDIYDFIEVKTDKDHYIYTYLADVTGHGISASLLSTTLNAAISLVSQKETDPVKLLSQVNQVLKAKTAPNIFVTLAFLQYDVKKDSLTLVNCGHEQPLIYRSKKGEVETLPPAGVALGMVDEIDSVLERQSIKLAKGDSLILYSDGYPEAWKNKTENLGQEQFTKLVADAGKESNAAKVTEKLKDGVNKFRSKYEQKDDMTLIVVTKI